MKVTRARYHRAILPEYRDNPLIEALRPKPKDEELLDKLGHFPDHSDVERELPAFERQEYLVRLKRLRQPLPVYIDLCRMIETAINEGYSAKNPLSPTTANYLHYSLDERPNIPPRTGFFNPKGCGITVIGESGVGKTSMLEQILSCCDEVIEHTQYKGQALLLKQVVWVMVDCPEDSSVKALCYKILDELTRKLEHEPEPYGATIPLLLKQIEAKIKSGFLGLLVIDEMQNLDLAKSGGAERLIAFLHNLVNNLGVPILFCANPPFNTLLEKTLKTARRAESNGYIDVKLLENDEEWELFVDELWQLQWTDVETPLTKKLSDRLHDLSVGNLELAMRIYREAQKQVIGSGDERINENVLEFAANVAIRASKKAVNAIKQSKSISVLKRGKDKKSTSKVKSVQNDKPEITQHNAQFITIPGDLSRPHHPEFSELLNLLKSAENLHQRITDPDIVQRASTEDDPAGYLRSEGLILDQTLLLD